MAATAARLGYGSTLAKRTATGPDVFTNIAELVSFDPPGSTVDTVDATHLASDDAHREFIAGLVDAGECSAEVNFTKTQYDTFVDDVNARATVVYKATLTDGSTLQFSAIPTGAQIGSVEPDGKITATATFKVTGKPTFTAAA
jgi:hypothetical protein